MAAALERLRKRSEFLAVAATNRRSTTPSLVLQVGPSPNDGKTSGLRVGFTATKKVGNAAKRNRARRRLRAAVHDVLTGIPAQPADIVVVARQGALTRTYSDLKSDLTLVLRRLEIVK